MSEQQDDQQGGTAWELAEAQRLMGMAVAAGDQELIATAMRRHAEALSNQAQTTLIPTLKTVLESVLTKQIGALTRRIEQSDNARLKRNGEFQDHVDKRFDAFGGEVETVAGLVREVQTSQAVFQASVDERVGAVESRLKEIDARHEELDDIQAWRIVLDQRVAAIERAHRDEVRAKLDQIQLLLAARPEQREQEHREVAERTAAIVIEQLGARDNGER